MIPGNEWNPIVYADEEVVIREVNPDKPKLLCCWQKVSYRPVFSKVNKCDWLCCGEWHWYNEKWCKYYSSYTANSIEEIVKIIKEEK